MTLQDARSLIGLSDQQMLPPPELFLHQSTLHGQGHVGRVMIHALRLVAAIGCAEHARPLWAAVYLHDIARVHDGLSRAHGADAWKRLGALPDVRALCAGAGIRDADYPAIQAAVTLHSCGEAEPGTAHQPLTDLLKDADGLDRVRLRDLNPRFLRTSQARAMTAFAEQLYKETHGRIPPSPEHFSQLWAAAIRLE
jgi:hypothetical protein